MNRVLLTFLSFFLCNGNCSENNECGYFLAPSFIPGAVRGIFAGTNYKNQDLIESTPSVLVPTEECRGLQLFNYVYGSDDEDYNIAVFGAAMLFNHRNPKTTTHYWHTAVVPNAEISFNILNNANTQYTLIDYYATETIGAGQEIFASYGDGSDWFTSRKVAFVEYEWIPSHQYTLDHLRANGHCMTDIFVNTSSIPGLAGLGVFTKKAVKAGDIVSISPVIVMPRHTLAEMSDRTVILNYCVCDEKSDAALFPIGTAGMMNHGGINANVKIEWFEWPAPLRDVRHENRLTWPIEELERLPFAPLDFKYVATRDIEAGEELLLSYGELWERAWMRHLDEMKEWIEKYDVNSVAMRPQFREPLTAPDGFFPANFKKDCIGTRGCSSSRAKKRLSKSKVVESKIKEIEVAKEFAKKTFMVFTADEKIHTTEL